MRPELIEDPVFLRYYEKWQKEPSSVVFAAISEIFRTHNMLDEAVQVCFGVIAHSRDCLLPGESPFICFSYYFRHRPS